MNKTSWTNIKAYANAKKMHIADYMLLCLEITEEDIRKNGGYAGELYKEIIELHKSKILASNKHRQEHRHITKYWVTKRGLKTLSFNL